MLDGSAAALISRSDPVLQLFHRQLERLRVLAGRLFDHLLLVRSQLDPDGLLRVGHDILLVNGDACCLETLAGRQTTAAGRRPEAASSSRRRLAGCCETGSPARR